MVYSAVCCVVLAALSALIARFWLFLYVQDLIKSAAEQGSPEVMRILLAQPLFKKDKDELDEAVDTGTIHMSLLPSQLVLACKWSTHEQAQGRGWLDLAVIAALCAHVCCVAWHSRGSAYRLQDV